MSTFKAVSQIWHTKENKYYEPGEVVDLSHLDGMSIAALLQAGAIVALPAEDKKKKKAEAPAQEGE